METGSTVRLNPVIAQIRGLDPQTVGVVVNTCDGLRRPDQYIQVLWGREGQDQGCTVWEYAADLLPHTEGLELTHRS